MNHNNKIFLLNSNNYIVFSPENTYYWIWQPSCSLTLVPFNVQNIKSYKLDILIHGFTHFPQRPQNVHGTHWNPSIQFEVYLPTTMMNTVQNTILTRVNQHFAELKFFIFPFSPHPKQKPLTMFQMSIKMWNELQLNIWHCV